jgi:hypothetical protein
MGKKNASKGEHIDGRIVELTNASTQFSAQTIVAALQADGIKAFVGGDDAGGWELGLGFATGYRVMVLESDLDAARAVIADT